MSRKTCEFKSGKGRDEGKVFYITEMSAAEAEDWAMNALFLLMGAGVEIPDEDASAGMAGLLSMGIQAIGNIPYEQAKPLLDRMMKCVQVIPNPSTPEVKRGLVESDIEEVSTRFLLRKAVWDLHVDFSTAADT